MDYDSAKKSFYIGLAQLKKVTPKVKLARTNLDQLKKFQSKQPNLAEPIVVQREALRRDPKQKWRIVLKSGKAYAVEKFINFGDTLSIKTLEGSMIAVPKDKIESIEKANPEE